MGKINLSLVVFLFVITGCKENKQAIVNDDLITVDVMTTDYPIKELVLQDFMDVEYIALETNDDFINQGFVQAIGRKIIVVKNGINDGDIFIYRRTTGEAIRKINHKGQGSEEYVYISGIVLDEDKHEMFVTDNVTRRMLVYNLDGKYKRSFKFPNAMYKKIYNFDKQNLICYNSSSNNQGQSFAIISKQDGGITQEIQIPFEEKKTILITLRDEAKNTTYGAAPSTYPIIPVPNNNWILVEPSSDTIYSYSSEYEMKPFLTRVPSIQSMNPEVFVCPSVVTDRYCFMGIVKKEYSFSTGKGFPSTYLMYDRQEKKIFRYTVHNNDYSYKNIVNMVLSPQNNEVAFYHKIEPYGLVDSYKKGELKGKLKEIAATLDEDSNPVIMLVKHKQ
ncbi:6-bladed beta-propeller [Parabacteroides sp. AM08-6]|uniref:6-bladed beta-propeller n=1 Tax=Parabacteroides sp. AM08-6 TaxID=2292053 RepID=UPI000EFE83E7|nr:6-bladed beta-propeller [Parabacteroides sp. AM08-6]RHJ85303.1 6-bladed beta-propeller [Parabacteroides sp. AM08-6]